MRKTLLLLLAAGIFVSCSTAVVVRPDDPSLQSIVKTYIESHGSDYRNDIEKSIIEESAYYLFGYLRQKYGEVNFKRFTDSIAGGSSISDAIRKIYNDTVYGLSYRMLRSFGGADEPAETEMKTTNVGVFCIEYFTGSPAERDMDKIVYLLCDYFDSVTNFFLTNAAMRTAFSNSLSQFKNGRIFLTLYNNRRQYGQSSVAATTMGFTAQPGDAGLSPIIAVRTAYFNVLSIYPFSHEISHAVMALSRLDCPLKFIPFENTNLSSITNTDEFGRLASEEIRKMPDLMETIKSIDETMLGSWGEGVAEYLTARANLYYRYGFFGGVNDELRFLQSQGKRLTPVAALLDRGLRTSPDIRKIMMNYQEMHSYVEYIVENYGWGTLYRIGEAGSTDVAFEEVLGMDREAFHKQWLAWLDGGE